MKIFQTIHKYPPHIPLFEKKHGITNNSDITFEDLRKLLIDDGFFESYILQPALEHKTEEVFYTIWNYNRLQFLWAKEHHLDTEDLDKIKLAQLEWYQPDVFYNLSPFRDKNFIELVKLSGLHCINICWNGVGHERPLTFPFYDAHVTLHRPFLKYWFGLGLKAFELQPGIPQNWKYDNKNRPIDVLFYGQYNEGIFTKRNKLINSLLDFNHQTSHKIDVHLQISERKHALLHIPKIKISIARFPSRKIRRRAKPPIYGAELHEKICNSKIVINAYGNYGDDFKSNMRVFESIGHGAFLISERGKYPEGLIPDSDFYTYDGFDELKEKVEFVLANWDKHSLIALNTAKKIRKIYSKENQYKNFLEIVDSI